MESRKCATKWCRGKAFGTHSLCSKCQMRIWKQRYPLKYILANLRGNARRRGYEFSLTLQQLQNLPGIEELLILRGRSPCSMSIDRIDPNQGYHIHNVEIIARRENTIKGNKERHKKSEDPF